MQLDLRGNERNAGLKIHGQWTTVPFRSSKIFTPFTLICIYLRCHAGLA
jgi:hypothetical protein